MIIKAGIAGVGNLGRAVCAQMALNPDFSLEAVFSRRPGVEVAGMTALSMEDMPHQATALDVLILCGGSATDLPRQTPMAARFCNVVDSFDTHAEINNHFENVDRSLQLSGRVGIISAGWDPGLFSLARALAQMALPQGHTTTFWGRGVSQGHSDAIRRIAGVTGAVQYTVPIEDAVNAVRQGKGEALTTRQKHRRVCYVAVEKGANTEAIRHAIVSMPNYFSDYNTEVNFISQQELTRNHAAMPHGGQVIRHGTTAEGEAHTVELGIGLESNPAFTASILVACARAAVRLRQMGHVGCKTLLDVPIGLLLPQEAEALRGTLV